MALSPTNISLLAGSDLALSILVAAFIGASFVALAWICWIFWRAAKRDAAGD